MPATKAVAPPSLPAIVWKALAPELASSTYHALAHWWSDDPKKRHVLYIAHTAAELLRTREVLTVVKAPEQFNGLERDVDCVIVFFHEYGRRVGMVPRSSLKEGKHSQMVEKGTKTTQQKTNKQNQPQPKGRASTIL